MRKDGVTYQIKVWVAMPQPPKVLGTIQAPYFKVPPGRAKGNKNG
jgi:hypothetical protein